MKKRNILLGITLTSLLFILASFVEDKVETVKIGNQEWMSRNLDVKQFRNGEPIPHAKTDEEWEKAGEQGKPAWCYYNNDPSSGENFGILYNYYAVIDSRGLAPEGWKVPTIKDYKSLLSHLGGKEQFCDKIKSKEGWKEGGSGSNESGFNGLPAGGRDLFGNFYAQGAFSGWWLAPQNTGEKGNKRSMVCSNVYVGRNLNDKRNGFSVRCLK